MNAKLVKQLADLESRNFTDMTQAALARLQVHINPAFGWHIASAYARAKVRFPVTVSGRDRWLFQAYLAFLNTIPCRHDVVEDAHQIFQNPGTSSKLKALLIAGLGEPIDAHLKLVAEKTGIPKLTVEAYEILFFNVLDRPRDGAYISGIVYPKGRLVEFDEGYFENTPIEVLLLRAAYNSRDIDLVLRLAGMTDAACRKELASLRDQEAELESRIMGNALLMANLGLLNQRHVGLQRATKLLAASRSQPSVPNQVESQKPYDIAAELAAALASVPPITDDERKQLQATARPGRSYWSDDSGMIYPIDPPEVDSNSKQYVDCPTGTVTFFPEPVRALWKNKDHDIPVILVARMSEPGFPDHYLTDTKTGIPASEVLFDN